MYTKQKDMTTLNISELVFNKGYFAKSDDFGYLVFDNEGSFELEGEVMEFDMSGEDVVVEYDLYVEGSIDDEGYAVTGSKEITIKKIFLGDDEIELDDDTFILLEKLVKSEI